MGISGVKKAKEGIPNGFLKYNLTMFIREKKNKSESVSIQIISKKRKV